MKRPVMLAGALACAACTSSHPDPLELEDRRLVQHFDRALAHLEATETKDLTPEQRTRRRQIVQHLEQYRARARFPRNLDFEEMTPYFVDEVGTRCAVAYLMERTGESTLVDEIRRTHNNAFVPELAEDPRVLAWVERNGLTKEEAAVIQPSYCLTKAGAPLTRWGYDEYNWIDGPPDWCDKHKRKLSTGEAVAAATSLGVSSTALALNLAAEPGSTGTGVLGLLSGIVSTGVGVAVYEKKGWSLWAGFSNILLGLVTSAVSLHTLFSTPPAITVAESQTPAPIVVRPPPENATEVATLPFADHPGSPIRPELR